MEEAVGMIQHNANYFNEKQSDGDELYEDSLHKNETIEHTADHTGVDITRDMTREPSKNG